MNAPLLKEFARRGRTLERKIIFEKWFWLLGTEMITSALKQLKVDVTSIVSRRQRCTLVPALAHDSQQL